MCGQENIEPRHSVWHLVGHFFNDITHFDGNFFTTLKDLLIKPGFLSIEYMVGRRQRYLNPVRMYVFTSAIFFILFFTIFNPKKIETGDVHLTVVSLEERQRELLLEAKNNTDSGAIRKAFSYIDQSVKEPLPGNSGKPFGSRDNQRQYRTIKEYDSIQRALPSKFRDGFIRGAFFREVIELNERYNNNSRTFIQEWLNVFFHSFPKLLFISLPVFALLLKLIYVRRKQFYYVDHGIFAIHLYIYSFIALIVFFGIFYVGRIPGFGWLWLLNLALGLFSLVYFYRSLRNFYGQGIMKTFLKFITLGLLSIVMIYVLFSAFFVYSFVEL